ncbi:hypothetical protein [Pseudonocardia sp. NPDC049154]|uniref:hypothetical protein n=1 Tax=Pseudonocardia sp. NPDC049154 TaxID=3155501 RepID=UPI003404B92A
MRPCRIAHGGLALVGAFVYSDLAEASGLPTVPVVLIAVAAGRSSAPLCTC